MTTNGINTDFTQPFLIQKGRAGFSFLEILVALMILVFGLTAIFGLFGAATYSHRRGVNDEILSRMATTIFSELESGQHPACADLQNKTGLSHPQFPGIYTYDLTFSAIPGTEPTTRLVTLDIKYSKGRSTILETFRTLIIFPF
ncbi:MAG: hypothetical protein AB1599_01590 [Planctomycetota bacterium]